jgi:preprotein translocase SecE subunit
VANKMSEKKKSASQSEMEEPRARASEREQRSAKASARDERKQPARRETKATSAPAKKAGGFRNNRIVRFTRESYHELRYKVTWPTFPEARNMTFVVIGLSLAIGLVLGLVDSGLFQLFRLVTGK